MLRLRCFTVLLLCACQAPSSYIQYEARYSVEEAVERKSRLGSDQQLYSACVFVNAVELLRDREGDWSPQVLSKTCTAEEQNYYISVFFSSFPGREKSVRDMFSS